MNRQTGFTLTELLIVVALVGILAAIAYPSYREQVIKARRADATTALTQLSARLERCFTRFNAYNNAACPDVVLPINFQTAEVTYQITGVVNAANFTLTATPLAGQAADAKCGALTLNSQNQRGESGTLTVNDCW